MLILLNFSFIESSLFVVRVVVCCLCLLFVFVVRVYIICVCGERPKLSMVSKTVKEINNDDDDDNRMDCCRWVAILVVFVVLIIFSFAFLYFVDVCLLFD